MVEKNIEIDLTLMQSAIDLSGLKNEKAVVDAALRLFIQMEQQKMIRQYRGKLTWEGNLEQMRLDQ